MSGLVLDLERPSACALKTRIMRRRDFECVVCRNLVPPGCALRWQNRRLYGWSESNVRYERLGGLLLRRYLRRDGLKPHQIERLPAPGATDPRTTGPDKRATSAGAAR